MRPRLLVLRSGERAFPADLAPELDLLEKRTHDFETLEAAAPAGDFDAVLFTSAAAVRRFLARGDLAPLLSGPAAVHAVGPATAELLRGGGVATVREAAGSARSLLESFPTQSGGARVLLLHGEDADDELPRGLSARGAEVVSMTLYRKTPVPRDPLLDEEIGLRPVAVCFPTSPSAARWFYERAAPESVRRMSGIPAIALGEPTRATLVSYGVKRVEIARPPTFDSAARLALRLAAARSRA
ncbi:MAG TPA: uroporphyrinogen-III synthase [Thermoanaerobaculia bacterium]|nr:uroporphyrinogen-III synthase [Thermoanaerobaculia bacterium]